MISVGFGGDGGFASAHADDSYKNFVINLNPKESNVYRYQSGTQMIVLSETFY
jgi:hypothetical protein